MKKILSFMLMMIGMVLASIGVTSCDNHHTHYTKDKDSLYVAQIVESVNNAEFSDQSEFMLYLVNRRDQARADSIVFRLHDTVVCGICNRLLSSGSKLSIHSICEEYYRNKSFYDGMNTALERPGTIPQSEYSAFTPGDSTTTNAGGPQ